MKTNKRFKLWVGGEVERTCGRKEVNRLLMEQDKNPSEYRGKTVVICDTITAVQIGK